MMVDFKKWFSFLIFVGVAVSMLSAMEERGETIWEEGVALRLEKISDGSGQIVRDDEDFEVRVDVVKKDCFDDLCQYLGDCLCAIDRDKEIARLKKIVNVSSVAAFFVVGITIGSAVFYYVALSEAEVKWVCESSAACALEAVMDDLRFYVGSALGGLTGCLSGVVGACFGCRIGDHLIKKKKARQTVVEKRKKA